MAAGMGSVCEGEEENMIYKICSLLGLRMYVVAM